MAGPQARQASKALVLAAVHLTMDTASDDIRTAEFTSSRDGDSPVLPDLVDQNRSAP